MSKPITVRMEFPDNALAAHLFGELDSHIKRIEEHFGAEIHPRGNAVVITGRGEALDKVRELLAELYALLEQGRPVDLQRVEDGIRVKEEDANFQQLLDGGVTLRTPQRTIHPRTVTQAAFVASLQKTDITFAVGPAGTGKTYLAVAAAVTALLEGRVGRIILTRPAVEAGERLGFLPGDLQAKVDPYLRPLYDALYEMMGFGKVERMMTQGTLEIAPLAYMRGRTLSEAFIILDEAQNTTPQQMKMFLTRFGEGSRAVVAGDITQIDLPPGQESGLVQVLPILRGVQGIDFHYFTKRDVVRHALVQRIVRAYERAEQHPREDKGFTA